MPFRSPFSACALALMIPCAHAAPDRSVEDEVLVVFKPGLSTAAAGRALGRRALQLDHHYGRISQQSGRVVCLVKGRGIGTARLIERLKTDPDVSSVEPDFLREFFAVTPNDTDFPELWGLRNTGQTLLGITGTTGVDTRFLAAWNLARPSSPEVVVGVVDSGVDITHPDLAPNIWNNPFEIPGNGIDDDGNGYVDDVHGYDFALGTANVSYSNDHGTHVAGTIAAAGRNAAGVIGVQYHAKILPLKISTSNGSLLTSAMLDAYDYAIGLRQHGVNLVALNASFGGGSSSNAEQTAIEALRDNGIILCAAAGNYHSNNDSTKLYPASYTTSNIIAVAALTQSNSLASFSNYGATSVDLAAPGENICSTLPLGLTPASPGVTVGGITYSAQALEYSGTLPPAGLSGSVIECGIGNPADFPPGVAGNIALIHRGTLDFSTKVTNAKNAGATAAIIADNSDDPLAAGSWTLGGSGSWIPAIQVTKTTGETLVSQLPASAALAMWKDPAFAYQFLDGTSMATPHVAGAVAFAAWNFPVETMTQRVARVIDNTTPVAALAGKMTTGGRLDLLKMVDTDNDGLPDWWENDNLGGLAENAAADDDADGFTHLDEFLAGTDPHDPASHLAFSSVAALEAGPQTHFMLSFPSVRDRSYQIEWSGSLQGGSWQPLGPPVTGTGSILQVQDTDAIHAAARRFYRMNVLPE